MPAVTVPPRPLLTRPTVAALAVPELPEEALHRVPGRKIGHGELRTIVLVATVGHVLHLDLHGHDSGLHAVDHVRKGRDVLDGLRGRAKFGMGSVGGDETALD